MFIIYTKWAAIAQSVQRPSYGLDGPGIESRWGRDRPWGPPIVLYNGYRVFPGGKERPGRDADSSPPSSAVGHERVELCLYSSYGPYGLYRASVPVQGCTLPLPYSRAIPLLLLWAVRPVQSLSACTRVHFIFLRLLAGIAQSVYRLATGWTVRGWNPCGDEIFRTRPDRPWGQPILLYSGYRLFPGVSKASWAWSSQPTIIWHQG